MFTSVKQSHLKFQLEDEKKYVCVFEHNVEDGYFTSGNVEKYESRLRFSILNEIGEGHKIRGMYEFKLEYPDIDKYILWRQSKRPQDATDSDLGEVEILYNDFINTNPPFNGLRRSGNGKWSYIDGHEESWHFAIGQFMKWEFGYIAGPLGNGYYNLKGVRLWLRIPQNCTNLNLNSQKNVIFISLMISVIQIG